MMDGLVSKDRDFDIDLEKGVRVSEHNLGTDSASIVKKGKVRNGFSNGPSKGENGLCTSGTSSNFGGDSVEKLEVVSDKGEAANNLDSIDNISIKEKNKKNSYKKPPRPPKGPLLDAADEKLIREISQIAMLKRARVERMKAKKMKAAKSSSSNGNAFAIIFTLLFCFVIIFQGMSSSSTALEFQESPSSAEPTQANLVSVEYYPSPYANLQYYGPDSESPNLIEQVSGSDPQENPRIYVD